MPLLYTCTLICQALKLMFLDKFLDAKVRKLEKRPKKMQNSKYVVH